MAISKVIYKSSASAQGEIWMDLTADTVASGNLISPNTAHGADGQSITGSVGSGTEGTPTATKGAVSNHSVNITPSVTNTAGVISGGTHTGTQVTVTAAELESGTKSITQNGTGIDVTGYSAVDVAVPSGGTGAVIDAVEQLPGGGEHHIITGVDISDTTAVAADVASGKYFYTADGTKTLGTASSGSGEGFPGLLLISSIFNANYNHANIYTGSETIQAYTGPVVLAGGASRIQKAYVRIGPIDLTNISLIQSIISIPKVSNGTSYGRLFIGANADDTAYSVSASQLESVTYYNEDTVHDVLSLDVSGFSGEYYIFTGTDSNGSSWGNSRNVSVFAIAASADGTPVFEEEPST